MKQTNDHQRLLTVRQVAARLAIHPRSVWRLVAAGELPGPVKLSPRIVRWREADLQEFIAQARG